MTDSKTAERKKLSVIKPGHWLNLWWINRETTDIHPSDLPNEFPWKEDGTWLCDERYVSREIAEEEAARRMKENADCTREDVRYLGPVFFPD